jgi:hypothetical protein
MKRLAAVFLLLAAPAFGQQALLAEPVPVRDCDVTLLLSVPEGNTISGPIDINPGYHHNIRIPKGTTIAGPIRIETCDGTITITGAPK